MATSGARVPRTRGCTGASACSTSPPRDRGDHRHGIFAIIGEAIALSGRLFAFFIVNIAVIWPRRTKPDMMRGVPVWNWCL
jgi:hypothetical protein